MSYKVVISVVLAGVLLFSCKNKSDVPDVSESEYIEITKAQFNSENMVIGAPSLAEFSHNINFVGTVIPSVNGIAQLSLPVAGVISEIYCKPGLTVTKGEPLFQISGNTLIDMQKDFAESAAVKQRLESEYSRAKELKEENIGSEKEYLIIESAFNAENAKYNALKLKLENIGLNPDNIKEGVFYKSYQLIAPINGNISQINATIGQNIDDQKYIVEIIDNQSFQVQLSVFENDIHDVQQGQLVKFSSSNKKEYTAKISMVGNNINEETRSIFCYADIENYNPSDFVSNQMVEGNVMVDIDTAFSLPVTAILNVEDDNYVLELVDSTDQLYRFKKVELKIGRTMNGFIELLEDLKSKSFLVSGTYNLILE
jgi:cobalt-zinc-cadmium efflux system membrane fusion protein